MFRPSRLLSAAAICVVLAAGPAAAGAEEKGSPEDLAREGLGKIVSALEMLLMTIPTYEAPEILPNGDIIIRRVDPLKPKEKERGDDGLDAMEEPKPI
ncbi:MAG: hypothetical protein RIB45_03215 [Marivibrio sp.]|uniref:hypothetical protein n=1 Tax=Marivibrio sp. TaxID=2039719 RepID=UPI0032ECEC5E